MRSLKSSFGLIMIVGLLLCLGMLATTQKAVAASCIWDGSTGNWSDSSHWQTCGGHAPGANDTASIGSGTVTIDEEVTVQSLSFYSGILQGSNNLTVTNTMDWEDCSFLTGSGSIDIASSATLTITTGWMQCGSWSQAVPFLDGRTLNVNGTAVLLGTNALQMPDGAVINNSGVFDIQSDASMNQNSGATSSVNNSGLLRKSGGTGNSNITGVLVNNTGTVQALSGKLSLAGGGTSTGSFSAAAGATLDFGGGTQTITLDPASIINGAGALSASNGAVSIGGSGTYAMSGATIISGGALNMNLNGTTANMSVYAGTLAGNSSLTVTNAMDWEDCSFLTGSGSTDISSSATLTITTGWMQCGSWTQNVPFLDGRTLNVDGTAVLLGTNILQMPDGAVINNSGVFDIQSDASINQNSGATSSVNNSGLLRKSGGTGNSNITGVQVTNTGTLLALSGTLNINNYIQNHGITKLDGGSLASANQPLRFYGGTLQGVGTISGNVDNIGGTVLPGNSAGVLHIAGNYTQEQAGKLSIELGGVITGTQYDVLDVTGSASLNGEMDVNLINGFTPITGTIFNIMNFSVHNGDFITETGTNIGGWLFLLPYYSSDHLYLVASKAVADLSVSVTDGKSFAYAGDPITYTLVVANAGPDPALGVMVTDTLPGSISNVTWTCVASDGSCSEPNGSGNLNTTVDLEAGGVITFTISGRLSPSASGTLTNIATISHPADPNPDNNSATDSDVILHYQSDVSVSITDGKTFAVSGDPITYTIVVANAGPDVANGVLVTDTLPEIISNVTWTCVALDGSCSAPSGSGNLSTTVNLEAGGTITITLHGRLSLSAVGTLSNTVTISYPADPNPTNNSATDSDVILYVKIYLPIMVR